MNKTDNRPKLTACESCKKELQEHYIIAPVGTDFFDKCQQCRKRTIVHEYAIVRKKEKKTGGLNGRIYEDTSDWSDA